MRIQLSLEFLIVFSFVLLVFIFMFALISNERSLGLGDQTFSQLQLQAQSIASAIDSAVQAGNGYSSSISIASLIGIVPYNVSITKNGVVILQAKVGKQIVKAVAYSTAKNVVSNLAYYYPQSNQYIIPISNGTMYIQNSFGNICIDYQCATQSNQAKSIFLSSQSVYAAEFSGPWSSTNYNSKSLIQASAPISGTNYPFTLTMWIKASNVQDFSHSWTTAVFSFSGYQAFGLQNNCLPNTCLVLHRCSSADTSSGVLLPYSIFNNKWYFIAVSVNYPNYYWQINNISSTDSNSNSYSSSTPVTIGTQFAQCDSNAFNGSIANVQVYSTNLLPSQIQALYQEGIGGAPIDLQHLVAWWPLNGNANDYSGNGNNGVPIGPIEYASVSQFFAKVLNGNGKPLPGTLVDFSSSYGQMAPPSSFTNQNGIATSFLTFTNSPGKALVKATAFNGNYTTANSLLAWYPLNLGVGSIAYSSNANVNGFIKNAFWNTPSYYTLFDGYSSYINLPQSAPNANSMLTVSAWFKTASGGVVLWNGNMRPPTIASCYSPTIYVTPQGYLAGGDSSSTGSFAFNTNYFVADNKWHFVVVNQTTTQQTLFLDGVEIGTVPITPQTCIPDNWNIGAGTVNNQISYFNGSIANVQMYLTSLNFGQVRQLYQEGIAGLPISNAGLVAWYPLGGDANDYSGNGNNGAIYGNLNMLQIQQSPSGNYSNVVTATFNPNGASTPDAFINIPSIVPVNYSRFSYFAWIKPTYTESYSRVLATSSGDGGAIEVATGGATQIMINGYNTTGWLGVNSYFPLNTWNLVGATYNGTTYIVYLNGKQVWSRKVGKLFGYAAPGNLQIGLTTAYPPSGNQFFGNIANVQFYSTNLTASEVAQLYQGGVFGLPLARGLVAWYPLLGNANDYSGNGNNGVSYNVTYTLQSIASPYLLYSFGGSGVEFNGQNSYIYNSSYAPLNLQPNFTIAAMVYLNSYANSPMIYSEGNPALTLGLGINSNGNLYAQVWNAKTTNNWIGFTSNLKVPLHTWTFVALSLNNGGIATGNAALYMNTQNQTFSLQEENNSGTHYLGIGFNVGYFGGQPFRGINGSIANLQIYNKALTPKQINELYNNLYPAYASKEVSMGVLP